MKGQRTLVNFLKELKERNDYILRLSQQTPKGEIISPIYPHIGIGVEFFGDKSQARYNLHPVKQSHKKRSHFKKPHNTQVTKPPSPNQAIRRNPLTLC